MSEETPPAGWYPQPDGSQRYWDGAQWTDHISDAAPGGQVTQTRKSRGCLIAVLAVAGLLVLLVVFWIVSFQRGEKLATTAEPGATSACGTPATAPGFDVQLGTPYLADGKDLIPVTVTNNTDSTQDVVVVLRQYDLEGCRPLEGYLSAQFDNLAPGQTGSDDAGEASRLVPTLTLQGMAYQVEDVNVTSAKGSPYSMFDPDASTG